MREDHARSIQVPRLIIRVRTTKEAPEVLVPKVACLRSNHFSLRLSLSDHG